MDYRKLRYFCVVAEEGSLHKATERLHLSQPALTRVIQDLEADVGVQLFTRRPRGVVLTHEGHVLLEHARRILEQTDAARNAMRAVAAQPQGVVAVGMPPSLSVPLMTPVAARVAADWPKVQLTMFERLMPDLLAMIAAEKLDLAIVGNPQPAAGASLTFLVREEVFLVAGADATLPETISLADAARHPLILPDSGAGRPSWVEEIAGELAGRQAQFRVESPYLSIALVRAGLGCAVLPRSALLAARGSAPLRMAKIEGVTLERHLATNSGRPLGRAASLVAEVIVEEMRRLDASDLFAGR